MEDWNAAFESAGFRNAVVVRNPPSPEGAPGFSPEAETPTDEVPIPDSWIRGLVEWTSTPGEDYTHLEDQTARIRSMLEG